MTCWDDLQRPLSAHLEFSSFTCGIHTCASFYSRKSTFTNRKSCIPKIYLSHTKRCEWPVRLLRVSWS